jgi:hypothetical protein
MGAMISRDAVGLIYQFVYLNFCRWEIERQSRNYPVPHPQAAQNNAPQPRAELSCGVRLESKTESLHFGVHLASKSSGPMSCVFSRGPL